MSATNSIEFNRTPEPITLREKLVYTFDLSAWLATGETVSSATARLEPVSGGSAIAGVISGISVLSGNKVRLTVDWTNGAIKKGADYLLFVVATIDTQLKEGFARFHVYSQ